MDELKHDDVSNRVEAMQKLDTIAIALGPERTLNELLPFLNEVAQDDEEEVFAVLATKLGDFVPLIGGHQNCEPLILILIVLASMEEPIVRNKAIDSLNKISLELNNHEIESIFLKIIKQLSQGNWFSRKIASCCLYKSVLLKVDQPTRKELLTDYLKLVKDEYPMVRRSAASNLPTLINLLTTYRQENNIPAEEIVDNELKIISEMFFHLIIDDQDSVKFLSIDILIAILEFFTSVDDSSRNTELLAKTLTLIKDKAWRVRYTAADRFSKIAENFASSELDLTKLIDPFIALIKDNEGEVRKAIAQQLPSFCQLLTKFPSTNLIIESKIIPVVNELSQDPQENVRASLASTITGLSPVLARQLTIDKLLPIFLIMLKDEFPDVRLNIISNLSVVNETIGINLLSTNLLPAITELAQDQKWRVRLAIIEYIPKLANQLGVSFFNDELLSLCMSWLWDPVYAIRDAAINNLKELTSIFGSDWADYEIVSRLLEVKNSSSTDEPIDDDETRIEFSNFIIRITCLFAITKLIPVVDVNIIVTKIIPFINDLVNDPVPNIRFNIAKSYLVLAEALAAVPSENVSKLLSVEVLPHLETLSNDSDVDVRFYANKSIQGIRDAFN